MIKAKTERLPVVLLLLLLQSIIAAVAPIDSSSDLRLAWAKEGWYNPSLVVHGQELISAVKVTSHRLKERKTWWINTLFMCEGRRDLGLQRMRCRTFDPWEGAEYEECELDKRVRGGRMDTSGLGDVKVWRWPGKGVFAVFGRKPRRMQDGADGGRYCSGLVVYHQWLALVKLDPPTAETGGTGTTAKDPWILQTPLPLLPSPTARSYPASAKYVMEKNWMPFTHRDSSGVEHLYVTYMVRPHIVFEVLPSGQSEHRWTTHHDDLMTKFSGHDVHGGPPHARVPANQSRDGTSYFLGVMHSIEKFENGRIRLYRHFAFKMAPDPPFNITAISDELPLVFNATYKERYAYVAFVTGLDVSSDGQVFITYGSADKESRALILAVEEVEELFTGDIQFRDINVPYERVEAKLVQPLL